MAWKCPACGFGNEADDARRCDSCGHTRAGRVVLVSEHTSQRLTVAVDTPVGKRLLRGIAGDDSVYASEPQFLLSRDLVEGGWRIAPAPGAVNPTFLNGAELTEPSAALEHGATLSIGPERLRLRVENEL
ncbi:MAG TPA: hypothetical protein VGR37_03255 [Longimicrobiaceae bacterium]|nr:hypothetical protein [Longimicrobiaceae bacterium]